MKKKRVKKVILTPRVELRATPYSPSEKILDTYTWLRENGFMR